MNFDWIRLFSENRQIKSLEVNDITLSTDSLGQVAPSLQAIGGDAHYPVAHMTFKGVHFNGDKLSLPVFNGDAEWDTQGSLSKVSLQSDDGKIDVELQPGSSRWQLGLHVTEASLRDYRVFCSTT
ncbi:MAG: hypothetical protein WDM70_02695 [Nitrosomonadales bacterium]